MRTDHRPNGGTYWAHPLDPAAPPPEVRIAFGCTKDHAQRVATGRKWHHSEPEKIAMEAIKVPDDGTVLKGR